MKTRTKRWMTALLCAMLMLALVSCASLEPEQADTSPSASSTEAVPSATSEATPPEATPALTDLPYDEIEIDMGQIAQGSTVPELKLGSTGPLVEEVKTLLRGLGLLPEAEISQYYDAVTRDAVVLFQETEGLEPSGRVNAATLAALRTADPAKYEGVGSATTAPQEPELSQPTELPSVSVEPALPPLTGIRIGIDPGHQAQGSSIQEPIAPGSSETKPRVSSGTAGVASGVAEYAVNLQVALKLRDLLESYGAEVFMTRETNGVDISNSERAQMLNEAGVDLAIRIHCDGEDDSSRHGAFVLVPVGRYTTGIEAASRQAAECVLSSFVAVTGARDLGLSERDDQTGFNWSTVPVINIEMGHMSNPEEDMKLVDDAYQDLCAEGIALGVVDYFS